MATGWNVDTNLFVDAMSKGIRDSQYAPSAFSSFVGGMISGYDKELDAETQRQQNTIRENQIQQLPVENRIQEAQADAADAKLAGVRDNPEQYAELARIKQENDLAEEQRAAQLRQKREEYMAIMGGEDGAAKGQAYLSGQYDEVLAADPKLKELSVERTYKEWAPEDRKSYETIQQKGRERTWLTQVQESMGKKYVEAQETYLNNDTISHYAERLEVNPAQLIEKGEFRDIVVPPKQPKMIEKIDPKTGKMLPTSEYERDERGSIVMEPMQSADPKDFKKTKAFFFDNKLVDDDVSDSDVAKVFNNYKQVYKYGNKLYPGQNGDTDRKREGDSADKQSAERQAAAEAEANATSKDNQSKVDAFFEGAKINPSYQKFALKVKDDVAKNIKETATPTPAAPVAPELNAIPTGATTSSGDEFFNKAVRYATEGTPTTPDGTPVNNQTVKFQGVDVPENSWVKKIRVREEMAASKASAALARVGAPPSSTPKPAPMEQAKTVTTDAKLPDRILTKEKADLDVIKRVASRPEIQGFSALVKGVMAAESAGKVNAISPTKVKGLMQVTSDTAAGISPDIDRADPLGSTIAGAIELEKLLSVPQFNSNPMLALTAYNVGAGVVAEAVRLAGSSDWSEVKKYIPQAVSAPRFAAEWARKGIDPKQKSDEALRYGERVLPYFAAFARTKDDMRIANNLKQQKVLVF